MYQLSEKDVLNRIKEKIGDRWGLELFKYTTLRTPSTFICKVHGAFEMKPDHILKGCGCRECARISSNTALKHDEQRVVNDIRKVTDDRWYLNLFIYHGDKKKSIFICNIHGDFLKTPNRIKAGYGCPQCVNKSLGEKYLAGILDKLQIKYLTPYKFTDLKGINNGLLSYDFFLTEYNCLVEVDGKQHYQVAGFGGNEESSIKKFITQKEHDRRKTQYAIENGIPLLRLTACENKPSKTRFSYFEDELRKFLLSECPYRFK